MIYGSVCSGIEAATMAWHPLGWTPAFFSEIEKFPSAELAHHYGSNMPGEAASTNGVPNLGDMTKFQEWPDAAIDVLVGGTPCQSFSVAGLRAGLADPRGNLMLTYLAIAAKYQPRWLVWENVPGVLSSNGGRDFGTFLGGLGECGYGFAYRVLDAQFCRTHGHNRAVPQRRRRVFVVGYLGDWRRAAAVLFDADSLRGNPPPRREAGQRTSAATAPSLTASGRGVERTGETRGQDPVIAVASTGNVAHCLNAGGMGRQDYETETMVAHTLRGEGFDASEDGTGKGIPLVPEVAGTMKAVANSGGWSNSADHAAGSYMIPVAPTLRAGGNATGGDRPYGTDVDTCDSLVAHAIQAGALRENPDSGPDGVGIQSDIAYTVEARAEVQAVAFQERGREAGRTVEIGGDVAFARTAPNGGGRAQERNVLTPDWAVRRLTPRECERLQGFPDNFTAVPYRGKPAADGPRYKALGNSMAVNVMRVLGERIAMVDAL